MNTNYFWAYRELTDRLEKQSGEPSPLAQIGAIYKKREPGKSVPVPEWGTIFLFDPEARARLDEKIHKWYFPAVLEGLRGTGIRVHDRKNVLSQIYDTRDCIATRRLSFHFVEPPRPNWGPDSPPWFASGWIGCSLEMCQFGFALTLEMPSNVNLASIHQLMADERILEDGPHLCFHRDISGAVVSSLQFSRLKGGAIEIERTIAEYTRKQVEIIKAVNRLEEQWESRELFADLSQKIIDMYGQEIY
jgi:hypothetical protein